MKKIFFFIGLQILLIIAGCKKDNNPVDTPTTQDVLIPLKAGNYWVYKIYVLNDMLNIVQEYIDTLKVISKSTDGKLYTINSFYKDVLNNDFYQNGTTGFGTKDKLLFKFPAKVGDKSIEGFELIDIDHLGEYCYLKEETGNGSTTSYSYIIIPNRGIQEVHISYKSPVSHYDHYKDIGLQKVYLNNN